jgi:hypothetical protein
VSGCETGDLQLSALLYTVLMYLAGHIYGMFDQAGWPQPGHGKLRVPIGTWTQCTWGSSRLQTGELKLFELFNAIWS